MFITALFLTNIARTYEKEVLMKLSKIEQVNEFLAIVDSCKGDVTLRSVDGDIFNLKSRSFLTSFMNDNFPHHLLNIA